MKVLEFVFSSFWVFSGTVILLVIIIDGVRSIINSIKRK